MLYCIEIHGFGPQGAESRRKKIFTLFAGSSFSNEIRVEAFASTVTDLKGANCPYIRLVAVSEAHAFEIQAKLKASFKIPVIYISAV
jgi:hypothetical protein